jgi:hypothetical protein
MAHELLLDLLLVVLELEPGHAVDARLGALGRETEDAVAVGVVELVPVGDVELGRQVGVERLLVVLDRRVVVGAGERFEDPVVGGSA